MTYGKRERSGSPLGFVIGLVLTAIIFGGLVWFIGGTWSSTDQSSMTCVYNGGPVDSSDYRGYQEPGSGRAYQGFLSDTENVPVAVRQYRISLDPSQGDTNGADSVNVRVKGYNMTFEPTVTFTINTEIIDGKPVSCDFIEKQLNQFGEPNFDSADGGWARFLNERLRPVLDDSMTRILQAGYDPGEVKFNIDNERDRAADEVGADLQRALERQLGDNYFCSSTYKFGGAGETCGTLTVVIPEPSLSEEDEAQLAKPQRARIDANNDIAAANEQARKAEEVAAARELEAESAERKANADEKIATENARVQSAQAELDYAWCYYLKSLHQDCALVAAAENNDFPDVIITGETDTAIAIPVPAGE